MGLSKLRSICNHLCDTSEVPFSMTHLLSRMVDGPRSCDNIGRMRDPHTSVSVQLPLTILKAPYISKSLPGCSRPSDPAIGSRLNANPEGAYRGDSFVPLCRPCKPHGARIPREHGTSAFGAAFECNPVAVDHMPRHWRLAKESDD